MNKYKLINKDFTDKIVGNMFKMYYYIIIKI